ncbi:SCAN domain-containing protein 3 [Trichonephila clavipes]|uniref:SCAN domain-containing protein 3 n=1 Tax=Trichonephila clavipes TaxID=2585209 RepID=A0A8X6S3N8_TRICX|nr:SCAN domain-containing protein 3 [Trichonephila clavipes]
MYVSKKKYFQETESLCVCPLVSTDLEHCDQVDLVGLQLTPLRNYKSLLHYQDHTTEFSFLRPLTSKRATTVTWDLLKIFLEVGCPSILQSDNSREFTAAVIEEFKNQGPSAKL